MTEPIPAAAPLAERIRQELSPSRIVAGVSTTVAVAAVAALVWVVGQEPDQPAAEAPKPAAVASAPARQAPVEAQPVAAHSAPSVVPDVMAPVTPSPKPPSRTGSLLPATSGTNPSSGLVSRPAPAVPSLPAAPAELPTVSWPQFEAPSFTPPPWAQLVAGANAQDTAGTVASAISGAAGGIGGGALNFLGAVIMASTNGNQNIGLPAPDGLSALMLAPAAGMTLPPPPAFDFSKLPPPPAFDFSKLPPPPSFDFSKLPPPPPLPPPPSLDNPLTKLPSITRAVGLPF
ncbi:hypothetical protein [Mycolicibacterium sp. HK-90]|uniref:hypothetical protein n=1 Tax=Mycolicibacterium sp. HK-90 TaxID=3056937 RepID=UPI002658BFAD|nr:hypothetical protein [Mycolicibacterium sp. HK-90]WKG04733.1 hypothetical protein QU592_06450 [Mycolicibacterium sp. HK-90]